MNEIINIFGIVIAGFLLGLLFFGGLWWTTQKGISSDYPVLWFSGSLLCRTSLILAGLYYVGAGDWHRIFACLAGFIIARMAMLRVFSLPTLRQNTIVPGTERES